MNYPLLKTPAFQPKFCDQLTKFQSIQSNQFTIPSYGGTPFNVLKELMEIV